MKTSPEVEPEAVTVAEFLKLYTVLPTRTLQGVAAEQPAPMVSVPFDSEVLKSPNCDAKEAPLPEPEPLPLPASNVQTFVAVHAYRLLPAAAALLKNSCPT